jgi:hypothetical protein
LPGDITAAGAGMVSRIWQAAGRDPHKLGQAAAQIARIRGAGPQDVAALAREAKRRAERAGAGQPLLNPEAKYRTPVRASWAARAAVQREMGFGGKAKKPAQKPDLGAQPANKPPRAPVNPTGVFDFTAARPAPAPAPDRTERAAFLASAAPVSEARNKSSSANETRFLTYADGSKAVFKPARSASWTNEAGQYEYGPGARDERMRDNITPGNDAARETAAYEVAKLVGMTDMVPVTMTQTFVEGPAAVKGRTGVLMDFAKNSQVAAKQGKPAGLFLPPKKIISSKPPYNGAEDFARAAVFDYIIGNEDRHPGNWMVNKATGKITLIDHGLSFPEGHDLEAVRGFMRNAGNAASPMRYDSYGIGELPQLTKPPADYAAPFAANKEAILNIVRNSGIVKAGAAASGVSGRIDDVVKGTKLEDWRKMYV